MLHKSIKPSCKLHIAPFPLPRNQVGSRPGLDKRFRCRSTTSTLAARLSYFLWSSMPDEELFRLAAQGSLRRGENLRAQVRRMLRDPRSRALAENFAGQWLQTRKLKEFTPDPVLFPDFDESLRSAMLEETELFFESIQRRGPQRAGVPRRGLHVRQRTPGAALRHPRRQGRRVSPGLAGRYAAGRRADAGEHPDGDVQPDSHVAGEARQVDPGEHPGHTAVAAAVGRGSPQGRQEDRAMRARSASGWNGTGPTRPVPPATGAWTRSASASRTSTPSAAGGRTTAGNRSIRRASCPAAGPFRARPSCKAALLARRDAFARCLAEKMLTYALGRGLERADRRAVDQIVARLARDGLPVLGPGPRRRRERTVPAPCEAQRGSP